MKMTENLDRLPEDIKARVIQLMPETRTVRTIRRAKLQAYEFWSCSHSIPRNWPVAWFSRWERYHPIKHMQRCHLWSLVSRELRERFEHHYGGQYKEFPGNYYFRSVTQRNTNHLVVVSF